MLALFMRISSWPCSVTILLSAEVMLSEEVTSIWMLEMVVLSFVFVLRSLVTASLPRFVSRGPTRMV